MKNLFHKSALIILLFAFAGCKSPGYIVGGTGYIKSYHFDCDARTLLDTLDRKYATQKLVSYPDTLDPLYKSVFPYFDLTLTYKNAPHVFVYRLYGDQEIISTSRTSMLTLVFVSDGKKERGDRNLSKKEKEDLSLFFQQQFIAKLPFYSPNSSQFPEAGH